MTPTCIRSMILNAEALSASAFAYVDQIERLNTEKVLDAFREEGVAARHFSGTMGYGYDDIGRDTLDKVYARAFGCEDALVRPSIASGTHALAVCLFGLLRPGETALSVTGKPYDTLEPVLGLTQEAGSLKEWGVGFDKVDLTPEGQLDYPQIEHKLKVPQVKVVMIQRSRGYDWRPSLSVGEIETLCAFVHSHRPDIHIMVDNCYGEFVEEKEPVAVGADIMVGSLIKNPGGGLAPTGGYVAGKAALVEQVAARLIAPGIGREVGSWAYGYTPFYQGFFQAPHAVAQALKSAILAARVFSDLGFATEPAFDAKRTDIIQAVRLGTPEGLIAFCRAVQHASPVDGFLELEPWDMPGYQHPVIMAAGTFVQGASIEWSADAPIREPYIAYVQGGLVYAHTAIGLERVLISMAEKGLLSEVE